MSILTQPSFAVVGPDQSEAARFIAAMFGSPDAPLLFQSFDDSPAERRELAGVKLASLRAAWAWIVARQKLGAGIYFTVNAMRSGKRAVDQTALLIAVWADLDQPEDWAPEDWPVQPSVTIETSRTAEGAKHQCIWVLSEPLEPTPRNVRLFKAVMRILVDQYGADPRATDLARVLRLPGTLHQKDRANPCMVKTVSTSPERRTLLELFEAFGGDILALDAEPVVVASEPDDDESMPETPENVARVRSMFPFLEREMRGSRGP